MRLEAVPVAKAFAADLGLDIATSVTDAVPDCDVVVSCVFGTVSLVVAEQALDSMRKGALYADMTTADPDQIRTAAARAAQLDVEYVGLQALRRWCGCHCPRWR